MEIELENTFVIFEKQFTKTYKKWEWSTFPCENSITTRTLINQNLLYLREYALAIKIFSPDEINQNYSFIGDDVPSVGKTRKIGLLTYDIKPIVPELEGLGLSEDARCIVLHLTSLVEQKDKNENIMNLFSLHSFKKLMHAIRKNDQAVGAIVAESWLLDTVIGARLGFHLLPQKSDTVPWNDGFWGQFIDQYGNVHTQRVNHFFETRQPPYRVRKGYILIKDIM